MNKDFYIGTSFISGVRTPDNIFDLPKYMFDAEDFLEFESSIRMYIKGSGVKLYLWPWMWQDSSMTDEVLLYDIGTDRIIYYQSGLRDFFDARLVRKQQSLEGCEVFDFKFQFPKMFNVPPVITASQRSINEKDHTNVLSTVWKVL